jgi:4-carboxymuconolactone decarboxylase
MTSRITPVTPGTRPELAKIESEISGARGRISPLYQVLLNSPPIAQGWEKLLTAIRNQSSLPADLREMIILRVAILNRAPYEFDAHVPHAQKAGMADKKIEGLRAESIDKTLYTGLELDVLAMTDSLTRAIDVPDSLFAPIRKHFSDQQIIDLTATIGAYNMVSRFLTALRIGH